MELESWRHLHDDFTTTTFTQVSHLIEQVMKEINRDVEFKKSSVVCMRCFILVDRLDELQEQIKVSFYKFLTNNAYSYHYNYKLTF